jgi:hypothetical protein
MRGLCSYFASFDPFLKVGLTAFSLHVHLHKVLAPFDYILYMSLIKSFSAFCCMVDLVHWSHIVCFAISS